jgi:hypothetical protein
MPRGVVGFEVGPRCLLPLSIAAMPPVSLGGCVGPWIPQTGSGARLIGHSSCMSGQDRRTGVFEHHYGPANSGTGPDLLLFRIDRHGRLLCRVPLSEFPVPIQDHR